MIDKNIWIVIVAILIVGTIFVIPKFGLFSVYPNSMAFPYSSSAYGSNPGASYDYHGTGGYQLSWRPDYGFSSEYHVTSSTSAYSSELSLALVNNEKQDISGYTLLTNPYLDIYVGTAVCSSENFRVYYNINNPISCSSSGCSGSILTTTQNPPPSTPLRINFNKGQQINNIYFSTYCTRSGGKWGGGILNIQPKIIAGDCVSGDKCEGSTYYACENYQWSNKGQVEGKCGYTYHQCENGAKDCRGIISSYSCVNYVWVNNGIVQGDCGVACLSGDTCNDTNKEYSVCSNYQWINQGVTTGKCGVECISGESCYGTTTTQTICVNNKWIANGTVNGKCGYITPVVTLPTTNVTQNQTTQTNQNITYYIPPKSSGLTAGDELLFGLYGLWYYYKIQIIIIGAIIIFLIISGGRKR